MYTAGKEIMLMVTDHDPSWGYSFLYIPEVVIHGTKGMLLYIVR